MPTRRTALTGLAGLVASTLATTDVVATTERKPVSYTAKQVSIELLRLANKIQHAQLTKQDRDDYSEVLESLSSNIQTKYNVAALCDTDTSCDKLVGGTR